MITVFFAVALATACFWWLVFFVGDEGLMVQTVMGLVAVVCGFGLVLSLVLP